VKKVSLADIVQGDGRSVWLKEMKTRRQRTTVHRQVIRIPIEMVLFTIADLAKIFQVSVDQARVIGLCIPQFRHTDAATKGKFHSHPRWRALDVEQYILSNVKGHQEWRASTNAKGQNAGTSSIDLRTVRKGVSARARRIAALLRSTPPPSKSRVPVKERESESSDPDPSSMP
jgi:hypothetical protein